MTVSNNTMMAQQVPASKEGQCKRGASDCSSDQSTDITASFSEIAQQMLAMLDTNKSGSVDKSEFSLAAQALAKSSGKTDTSGVDAAFAKADPNNDGQISSDEFMNALKLATEQTQKKNQHRSDVTASNILPQAESAQPASPMNEMQKNLLNKIMAAYSTPTTVTGSTTNISV